MNARLVAALLLAPLATAGTYAALLYWQFQRMEPKPENASFFFPGFLGGLLFEVFALLPLLLILRRFRMNKLAMFMANGFLLWLLFVFAFNASVMPIEHVAWATMPMLPPGIALVLVFGVVAFWRADA